MRSDAIRVRCGRGAGSTGRLVDVVRRLLLDLYREIRDDGVFDTAAGVAFWLLLSLPAALLAALSSVSLLGDDLTDELRETTIDFVDRVFTSEAATLRSSVQEVFDQSRPGVLSVSIATAVFTLSRGFAGLIRALDVVYDIVETRNFLHTRALAIGLAIGTLATVAGSTALWAATSAAGAPLGLRLAAAFLVLIAWSATIFHIGPNHHTPWRYDLPGALVAGVGWLALSAGFRWYIQFAGSGNVVGVAGALLLALTWVWAACVVLLVAGELNQLLAERAGVIQQGRTLVWRVKGRLTSSSGVDGIGDDGSGDDGSGDELRADDLPGVSTPGDDVS